MCLPSIPFHRSNIPFNLLWFSFAVIIFWHLEKNRESLMLGNIFTQTNVKVWVKEYIGVWMKVMDRKKIMP